MGTGSTDSNGNFTFGVLSNLGKWALNAEASLIVHGYPGFNDRVSVDAGETGVILRAQGHGDVLAM